MIKLDDFVSPTHTHTPTMAMSQMKDIVLLSEYNEIFHEYIVVS